ncbi:hypothetical protein K1T71_001436 [Dendrolimus kikuchii]|uniref:Uncharacterized protein n=1 Tax=Dendrolimus kikuchii TaxID=765133 RepID=A0ACC1DI38_9NEOP|nr:hypothetical protein K1T71_001436 [Dendrolimus kikuchii]
MREVPECLNRRYQALDEMIKELNATLPQHSNVNRSINENTNDPGLRLMCDFWNILKEDPDCDLSQQVQQRMGLASHSSYVFRPQQVTCYMADRTDRRTETGNRSKSSCCGGSAPEPKAVDPKSKCCASKSVSPSLGSDVLPLSKVLCNLKDAASFDKKCNARINDLMVTQKELKDQIQHLEHREQEGIKALKQADCMWSCMEDAYKAKIAESLGRQKDLLKQLKEVEASTKKWRKNKKDLEYQLDNINKCQQEITEKIHQKTNDIKCMDMEIADFKKRTENNKKEMDAAKKSLSNRKQASDAKMANIASEMTKLKKILSEENNHKLTKEQEGKQYVKEAREDLQKICRVLLQKKLENEDLLAEKDALLEEINLLKQTSDQCKDKCKNKQQTINDEILKLEKEIAEYKVKCIRCHQCTDTVDVRKFCTDCPKCMEERDCLYEDDHCNPDHTMDCVCMSVKQKFLDNVFENMYTVLERQTKSGPGKAVAEAVLQCLKRSRNGKLNDETRKILQDFILSTIKKNLNLTIVGGAVKTRCEMDPETYKQLMLCLNKVKVSRPPKEDKGTAAKKESCRRWGGSSECNCPKGPKACVCTKKAPPPPRDPSPCPPPDKDDAGATLSCPHKDSTACGPDCAMHAVPSCVGADVSQWRPDPCQGQSCVFSKNMRAAQCVLGPESLSSLPKSYVMPPYIPDIPITCKCGNAPMKPCTCREDSRNGPRERIIEEVMGRYVEVSPIDKVSDSDQPSYTKLQSSKNEDKDDLIQTRISKEDYVICSRSSNSTLSKSQICYDLEHQDKKNKKIIASLAKEVNIHPSIIKSTFIDKNIKDVSVKFRTAKKADQKQDNGDLSIDSQDQIYDMSRRFQGNCNKEVFDERICDTVRDLLKDIIAPEEETAKSKFKKYSMQFVPIQSLLKEIEILTRESTVTNSFATLNEKELNIESLETLKETHNIIYNKYTDELTKTNGKFSNVDRSYSKSDENKCDEISDIRISELDKKSLTVSKNSFKDFIDSDIVVNEQIKYFKYIRQNRSSIRQQKKSIINKDSTNESTKNKTTTYYQNRKRVPKCLRQSQLH